MHESVTSRYHADMRTKDILVHRYDTLIECFLALLGYDKVPEEGFDNYWWEGFDGGRKYRVNVSRWLKKPKMKAWGWASYRQKTIHLWWDPDCAREELASVIAHEFAHLHRPRHKNKMEEEKKADLCGRAARFAMTVLMGEEITVSSDKELSVKNVLENLSRVLGPLSEDRPKCDFVHCVAGGGVAGHGSCFLRGNKGSRHCPNFMTEEDFKAGRIPVSKMGMVVGYMSFKTYKKLTGKDFEDLKKSK